MLRESEYRTPNTLSSLKTENRKPNTEHRCGFTLIELLIVVAILLILAGITVGLWTASMGSDRMRGAARQMQSALLGARDRAIYAGDARGLRLTLDPNLSSSVANPPGAGMPLVAAVTSMQYIQQNAPRTYTQHEIQLERLDLNNDLVADSPNVVIVRGMTRYDGSHWQNLTSFYQLQQAGLLVNGARIQIPAPSSSNPNGGTWYTLDTTYLHSPDLTTNGNGKPPFVGNLGNANAAGVPGTSGRSATEVLLLSPQPFRDTGLMGENPSPQVVAYNNTSSMSTCRIMMAPTPIPNTEPINLPAGVAINLYFSKAPSYWAQSFLVPPPSGWYQVGIDGTGNAVCFTSQMDVLFSPRGTLYGPLAAQGLLHFYLEETDDLTKNLLPQDPTSGQKLLVSLYTQTGNVATSPVYINPLVNSSGSTYYDYYFYAETGEVANR